MDWFVGETLNQLNSFFFLAIAGILVARLVCDLKMDPTPKVEGCGRNPHSWRDMH
jgi:hypothetical protein